MKKKQRMGWVRRIISFIGLALLLGGILLFILIPNLRVATRDYTQRSSKEYAMISDNVLLPRPEGGVYCLSGFWSAVNVYSAEGEFLYSLPVPDSQNGRANMYMEGDTLVLADKLCNVFFYRGGEYQGRAEDHYDANEIGVYGADDALLYAASYPEDDNSYSPICMKDGRLYAVNSNQQLLAYQDGILVLSEEDGTGLGLMPAGASATDGSGNVYRVAGIIPRLIRVSADGQETVISETSLWDWLAQQPFAALLVAALGIALTAVARIGMGKTERPMIGEE